MIERVNTITTPVSDVTSVMITPDQQTSSLHVFVWLLAAVLITVIMTMVFGRLSSNQQPKTNGVPPIYRPRTSVVSKNEKAE